MNLTYGVCVGSWQKLGANVVPHIGDRPLLALSGQSSIAVAYNSIMEAAAAVDTDILVLQHDDLEIVDPAAEAKIISVLEDHDIGILGIAGGLFGSGIAWWNNQPIGHQRTDVRNIDFGKRTGEVDLLEGSLLALPRRALRIVRFDTDYPGFHGYDVDISMQVRDLDLKVIVADIDTWHHTNMGYKSDASHRDWLMADELFRTKWGPS